MRNGTSRRALLKGGLAIGAGVVVGACAPPAPAAPPPGGATAITGVTVVDATGVRPGSTVLVVGERIARVGPAAEVAVPAGATRVEGAGRFLIPGLVDAHVHSVPLERTFPPLFLVNGVTTVREMGGFPQAAQWRDRVAAGEALGPRSVVSSTILDGSPSLWEGIGVPFRSVADAGQARAAVREEKAAGVDFIKTYTRLGREAFAAIADESRRQGIPFLGHCPDLVPVTEASDAGLATLEHLWQLWYATSRDEARLRRAVAGVPIAGGEYGGWYAEMHAVEYAAARSTDRSKAADVYARLAANGTFVTPTLSVHRVADVPADLRRDDPRLAYLPPAYAQSWPVQLEQVYLQRRTPETDAQRRELFDRRHDLVAELGAAGVPLLAGTDTGTAYLLPGFALHEELALLVRAGLTPAEALRAATLEPARHLGREADLGTVEEGKVADLVLLDADPLRDIANTTRIDSVVARGCLLDRAARDRMLDDVLAAAQEPTAPVVAPACPCHR
ncbi:amidohydrolase family protein [Pseudonocardia humida]|uniref:Amidohydrolase family protein n=1 Tax=Pseudonocardia humida TaxID=2800819 RepID=A0ABT1A759_9PSEU|nr:amidohydrolase family protein [Pseudonocardia humida]MCO1658838.1 amidohydrolase family protein [Pseudonocardia humida]